MTENLTKKLTLRYSVEEYAKYADMAHASRISMASMVRQLARGTLPPKAPPAAAELGPDCIQLLKYFYSMVSNCTQLAEAAIALGDPFDILASDTGILAKMSEQVRQLALSIKSGGLSESMASRIIDGDLPDASRQFNDLAHELNLGHQPAPLIWQNVLSLTRKAIASACDLTREG